MAGKLAILAFLLGGNFLLGAEGVAEIDPSLKQKFLFGGDTQNVMVSFTQGIQTVFDQINGLNFTSQTEKRSALTTAQENFANMVQGGLKSFLNMMGVSYQSFWINNKMIIPNVDSRIVNMVSRIPGVAKIEKEPEVKIYPFEEEGPEEGMNLTRYGRQTSAAWGIEKIRAKQVWGSYKGKGIVVANIDTGVRYTHVTLRGRWRTTYGWYDPYTKTTTPNDQDGHGTHTMGTIAGTNDIGVAPEATWIACKACDSQTCGLSHLIACGQWIQCPTPPSGTGTRRCDLAPHIVSNSWGGAGAQSWYDEVINSWQTSGIIPVFSIGNSGPQCYTTGSPGDRPKVIAVGSTDIKEKISAFSSLGPSTKGLVKPDIVAPGEGIRSAWHTSDTAYNTIAGTSMACPHVSGVIALMKQKKSSLTYDQVYNAITKTAVTSALDTGSANSCGSISPSTFPNNVFGHGRIDAVNSVNAV